VQWRTVHVRVIQGSVPRGERLQLGEVTHTARAESARW
jgi:hypothetical protein